MQVVIPFIFLYILLKDLAGSPIEEYWSVERISCGNNEQLPVPGVPFPDPDEFDKQVCLPMVLLKEQILVIFIYCCMNEFRIDIIRISSFMKQLRSLSGTEGLIIDIRYNIGGWSIFESGI